MKNHDRSRPRRRASWRLLALVIALLLVAAACGTDEGGAPEGGDIEEITWALPDIPDILFVPYWWTTYEGAIMSLAQEGLLAFDDDLALTNAVAESWEQVDPTTYVYTIREGVKFHDGSLVTAADVAASMRWHLDEQVGSELGVFYLSVESIEATGDREVTVKLTNPDVQWQYTPAHMAGFIMPQSQIEGDLDTLGSPDNLPLGSGPYQIVEFIPGDRVVLERFDDYWGDAGPVKRIIIIGIPDDQTRLLAMRSGDIDGTFDVPVTELDQWEALDNVDVITASSLGVVVVTMDYETEPFDDIHVRRAIAHSLDQEGLISAVLSGRGESGVTVDPPGMWAGVLSEDEARSFYSTLPQYEFDMEKAAAELAQSKVPDGFEFTVQVPSGATLLLNPMLNLAENLRQIGVTLTVEEVDGNTWLNTYFGHGPDLGMQTIDYYPDFADPVNYPLLFLYGPSADVDGFNASNFVNERVDELIDLSITESDPAAREAALKEMFEITTDEVAVIPVFYPDSAMAIRSDLRLDGYTAFWYNIPWAIRGFGTK